MLSVNPLHITTRHPNRGASQPVTGAAKTPMAAAGERNSSADAVADRNNDAKARLIITADGGWRRGKVIPLKQNVDAALTRSATVEKCIVLNRCNQPIEMKAGREGQ